MLQSWILPWRWLVLAFLFFSWAWPAAAAPVQAAETGSGALIVIDFPASSTSVVNGEPVHIAGWAVDPAGPGPGTGVERVEVYLDGQPGAGGVWIGTAAYGTPRADVAASYGRPDWTNSGFILDWTPMNVSAGDHALNLYVYSSANAWLSRVIALNVSSTPGRPSPELARADRTYGPPMALGPMGGYGLERRDSARADRDYGYAPGLSSGYGRDSAYAPGPSGGYGGDYGYGPGGYGRDYAYPSGPSGGYGGDRDSAGYGRNYAYTFDDVGSYLYYPGYYVNYPYSGYYYPPHYLHYPSFFGTYFPSYYVNPLYYGGLYGYGY